MAGANAANAGTTEKNERAPAKEPSLIYHISAPQDFSQEQLIN
jgi:hypothetical protein